MTAAGGGLTVVTGAAGGIGASIAAELARRGHRVVVTDADAEAAARQAGAIGSPHRHLDVTDGAAVAATVEELERDVGPVAAWVNNAGVSSMARFLDVRPGQLDRTLAVNLRATFLCSQAAARAMVASGTKGRIVNIASMAGKQGRVAFLSDYVASKFGVVGLTQASAYELAAYGITVNAVCPGYVRTPMQDRELGWEAELRGRDRDAIRQMWIDDTPLGRLEEPEDVARAVAFLLSDDAAFITGEALAVNGGAFMD